jgi:hypothetical protein
VGVGKKKRRVFICNQLTCCQFKLDYYTSEIFCAGHMENTKQRSIVDTEKIKESKHTTKIIIKSQRQQERNTETRYYKSMKKI